MDYSICKIVGEDEISATEEKKSISRESAGFFSSKSFQDALEDAYKKCQIWELIIWINLIWKEKTQKIFSILKKHLKNLAHLKVPTPREDSE